MSSMSPGWVGFQSISPWVMALEAGMSRLSKGNSGGAKFSAGRDLAGRFRWRPMVSAICEGLNRATFFRHFTDKREALFGGEDVLAGLFGDAIRDASRGATLTGCLKAAFTAAESAPTPQQRARAGQRRLVAAANPEVQERGLLKHARIAGAIDAALRERGADELTARLAAEVGMLAFRIALERWIAPGNDEPFAAHAEAALAELETRAAALNSGSRLSTRDELSEP